MVIPALDPELVEVHSCLVTNRVHRQIVAGKLAYLSKLFYPIAGTFTRLSILFFYYRLIQDATWTRTFRWVLHATVASVLVLGTVIVFLAAFQCTYVCHRSKIGVLLTPSLGPLKRTGFSHP